MSIDNYFAEDGTVNLHHPRFNIQPVDLIPGVGYMTFNFRVPPGRNDEMPILPKMVGLAFYHVGVIAGAVYLSQNIF